MHDLQRDDLEQYRRSEHLVLQGRLAARQVFVVITPYAQRRMHQRDINEEDILAALALPRNSHEQGKTEERHEVAGDTGRGVLRVVYERPLPDTVVVVTAYPEFE